MSQIVQIPTAANIQAAWDRYAALMRVAADEPDRLLDRDHCEALVLAWSEWRDLFLSKAR